MVYIYFGFSLHPCRSIASSRLYPDDDCVPRNVKTVHEPPLLFDLYLDPSEVYPLTMTDPEYNQTMSIILKVLRSDIRLEALCIGH